MKIILKNALLAKTSTLIAQVKAKGRDAIALAKFKKLLDRKLQEVAEDEQTLIEAHKTTKDGQEAMDDDYAAEHKAWLDEDAEIEGGTYVNHIDDVDRILDAWVEKNEISGGDLDGYLALHEAFEDAKVPADEAKED